jgi:hypothetical protein
MIVIKTNGNRIFTNDSLEKCKKSFIEHPKCNKDGCRGLSMGNGFCRWHGGENSEYQKNLKKINKVKRRNNCNRARAALKKKNKKLFQQNMEMRNDFRKKSVSTEENSDHGHCSASE